MRLLERGQILHMLYTIWHNSQNHRNPNIGLPSNGYSDISRGHVIFTSHMADRNTYTVLKSQCIVMQTGHQVQIGNPSAAMYFYSQVAQFPGVRRNRQPLHCQLQKPSTLPLPMLPNKSYGSVHYLMNSKFHNPRHQFYSRIIRQPSLYPTIPNFTR